jgi:hypothetical protein
VLKVRRNDGIADIYIETQISASETGTTYKNEGRLLAPCMRGQGDITDVLRVRIVGV